MRIYRYVSQDAGYQPRLAIAHETGPVVDLIAAWSAATGPPTEPEDVRWLTSVAALVEAGPRVWDVVAAAAREAPAEARLDASDGAVRWLCPLDRVASLRDFLAFEDHVQAGARRRAGAVPDYWYEAPIYYKGNHRALLGPDDACPWPDFTEYLDFELELAMIVGRRGRDIATAEAGDHIFGFTIFNDLSARDIQSREMSAWLGPAKGKDFANAFGPCVITADEVGTEPDLEMICRVNGKEWGRARSSSARWRWADMIAHVSRAEDVWPNDVYGSGTPGGCCGLDLGRRLSPGDVVELEIERIGILRTPIGTTASR